VTNSPSAERHIATVAVLDVIASAALLGLALWLFVGARASINAEEHVARVLLAQLAAGAGLLFFLLWAMVERRWRIGRVAQIMAALALLTLIPFGTAWSIYVIWALTWRGADGAFGKSPEPREEARPYWGAITAVTVLGVAILSFAAVRGRAEWLQLQVERAGRRAEEKQQSISDKVRELRGEGILEMPALPPLSGIADVSPP
jgi:hypothetical protein